jgi:hypothetical protein
MKRHANRVNVEWETMAEGFTWEQVGIEVLMDIRSELQTLNRLLHCPNFTGIPQTLRSIRRSMPTRKRKAK